jgi:uncharacterized phage-associated protein
MRKGEQMEKFDIEKVANAIKFFQDHDVKHLGKTKLMKMLFFADKYHLQNYGRPIFYDRYFRLPHGPVPSITLNVIDSLNEVENYDLEEYAEKFRRHIAVNERTVAREIKQMTFTPLSDFDEEYFARSELEMLQKVAEEFRTINARRISELSHTLPEYANTPPNDIIDYSVMAPEQREYLDFIEETNREFEHILR